MVGWGLCMGSRYPSTQQTVALKVLHALVGGESGNARFEREAQLLATLEHGVVRHRAWVACDGRGYLAMDWLEGEDLATRLRRGPLGGRRKHNSSLTRAAEALGVAHSRDAHRDIKPSNLFLTADGDIKVIDFGIARTATVALDMTRTGMILGTPGYLARTARRGARALDARADVFALGCVLFECLTGQPAFSGDNPLAILSRVLSGGGASHEHVEGGCAACVGCVCADAQQEPGTTDRRTGQKWSRRWSGCCGRVRRLWRRWRRGGTRRSR